MIKVVNKRNHQKQDGDKDIYIGRGSVLGNPYTHIPSGTKASFVVGSRQEAIEKYSEWVNKRIRDRNPEVIGAIATIVEAALRGNVNLVCYCFPRPCHGHCIRNIVEQVIELMAVGRNLRELIYQVSSVALQTQR